jgi:hypothetical protein
MFVWLLVDGLREIRVGGWTLLPAGLVAMCVALLWAAGAFDRFLPAPWGP